MANHTTGAQRYNKRMDEIFARSKVLNEKYHGKDSFGSTKSKSKALHKAKGVGVHEVNHTKEGSAYAKEHFRKFGNK